MDVGILMLRYASWRERDKGHAGMDRRLSRFGVLGFKESLAMVMVYDYVAMGFL